MGGWYIFVHRLVLAFPIVSTLQNEEAAEEAATAGVLKKCVLKNFAKFTG